MDSPAQATCGPVADPLTGAVGAEEWVGFVRGLKGYTTG